MYILLDSWVIYVRLNFVIICILLLNFCKLELLNLFCNIRFFFIVDRCVINLSYVVYFILRCILNVI